MTVLRPSSPDIIASGASAGGLEAIIPFVRRLPVDLPATVLVVLHRSPYLPSRLEEILRRETRMRVRVAEEGLVLAHGTCLINPPDRYMMVTRNMHIHLVRDGFYPGHCIDVLLNSLASCAGPRSIGIILSGMLKDGALAQGSRWRRVRRDHEPLFVAQRENGHQSASGHDKSCSSARFCSFERRCTLI